MIHAGLDEVRAGVQIEPGNPKTLADAVLRLRGMSREERAEMGMRRHNAAVEQYEYGLLAMKLAKVLSSEDAASTEAAHLRRE